MAESRPFLSIGDVLSLLKEDFPDITISKIRFLESQGLLDPERTPSGYRKFYDEDVERLRWVLRQQREHFLPLKVIKGRLEGKPADTAQGQLDLGVNGGGRAVSPAAQVSPVGRPEPAQVAAAMEPARSAATARARIVHLERDAPAERTHPAASSVTAASMAATAAVTTAGTTSAAAPAPAPRTPRSTEPGGARVTPIREVPDEDGQVLAREALGLTAPRSGGDARAARASLGLEPPASDPETDTHTEAIATESRTAESTGPGSRAQNPTPESSVSMTAAELASATDLPLDTVEDLIRYGLISGRQVAGAMYYGEDALTVARLAAGFRRYGIDARHIRAYRLAAEREVGLFEQVILPILKQRNPEAKKQARQAVTDLSRLGQQMRTAMVRSVLHGLDKL